MLATCHIVCNSLFSRCRGLMFARKAHALVMVFPKEQRVGIHMWFVFFPIDVIWLDNQKRVVFLKKNLQPWRMITPPCKARYVVEVPDGVIGRSSTGRWDILSF